MVIITDPEVLPDGLIIDPGAQQFSKPDGSRETVNALSYNVLIHLHAVENFSVAFEPHLFSRLLAMILVSVVSPMLIRMIQARGVMVLDRLESSGRHRSPRWSSRRKVVRARVEHQAVVSFLEVASFVCLCTIHGAGT